MQADRVGYGKVTYCASDKETDRFAEALTQAMRALLQHKATAGRRRCKLATISYPVQDSKGDDP